MTDKDGLSRRTLLGSLGTVGIAGATLGAGTTSLLSDGEVFRPSTVRAGLLDLLVSWSGDGGSGTSEGGNATVEIDLRSGGQGSQRFTVEHTDDRSNPARVWLRTTCPTGQADAVRASLTYACNGAVIASGTLLDVANSLRNGVLLDSGCATDGAGCLGPGDAIELVLTWEFSPPDDYRGGDPDDIGLTFEYRGLQCRQRAASNPFEPIEPCVSYYGVSYIEIYADDSDGCDLVGKLELESKKNYDQPGIGDSYIEPGTYDLYEDDAGPNTGYDVVVTDTVDKDGEGETIGVAFELVDPEGDDPDLCKVVIKGGPGTVTYDERFDGNGTDRTLYAPVKGD